MEKKFVNNAFLRAGLSLIACLALPFSLVAKDVTLTWDPVVDEIRTYRLYWGLRPGMYLSFMDVGTDTIFTLEGLDDEVTYYIAVTAVDFWGNESLFSNEVSTLEQSQTVYYFQLLNIYPNPFNQTTTIFFSVPDAMAIKLTLYDVKGRRVRVLEDGTFAAGEFQTQWDGRTDDGLNAPSGVYICILSAKEMRISRSLVLLR